MTLTLLNQVDDPMSWRYSVTIEPDQTDDGPCYFASHPEILGCAAQGKTPEEAVVNLNEARRELFAVMLSKGLPIPEPRAAQI